MVTLGLSVDVLMRMYYLAGHLSDGDILNGSLKDNVNDGGYISEGGTVFYRESDQ